MATGAFGVGQAGGYPAPNDDANDCVVPGFNYRFSTSGANTPFGNPFGASLQVFSAFGDRLLQLMVGPSAGGIYTRSSSDAGATWGSWRKYADFANDNALYFPAGGVVQSFRLTVADNAVATITTERSAGYLAITTANDGSFPDSSACSFHYFDNGSSPLATSVQAGSNTNLTTGVLTGATGADGRLTISHNGGNTTYIENRLGASRSFSIMVLA